MVTVMSGKSRVLALLSRSVRTTNNVVRQLKTRRSHVRSVDTSMYNLKQFNHAFIHNYKTYFSQNTIPLIGGIPSKYLSDIKPLKNWKFGSVFTKSGDTDSAQIALKPRKAKLSQANFKKTVRKKLRLRMMRLVSNNNIKNTYIEYNILNFKFAKKERSVFKVSLRRPITPTHIMKWKNSYPLMFTDNMYANKLLKPQLDLTIKTFIQSRNNRRVRRFKKTLFKKLKRSGRGRRNILHTLPNPRRLKRSILISVSKNSLTRNKDLRPIAFKKNQVMFKKTTLKNSQTLRSAKSYPFMHQKNQLIINWNSHQRQPSTDKRSRLTRPVLNDELSQKVTSTKKLTSRLLEIGYKLYNAVRKPLLYGRLSSSVWRDNTNPTIKPRTKKNFIFKNFGAFLTSLTLFNQKKPFTYKYLFKKKIFSFLYPNEVRNALMARKKKIMFYQLVYKTKHRAKDKNYHSFASFNKFFINHYKTSLKNNSNTNLTKGLFSKLFTTTDPQLKSLELQNYVSSRDEVMYDQNFSHRGVDLSFKISEVKIPRIRFRPGYQRMWRNARTALKESMGLKFVYQQQLTRHLVRFYKNSNKYSFARSEMSANRVIMYSRLLPDNPTIGIFTEQKLIYLNGKLLPSLQSILVPNDIVQLIVSVWYYVAYRWISNWTLKRHKKFKKLVYRKGLAGKHKVMKLKKQRSYYTPNWIYLARYDISDIKPFLEVDYFTLSAFVLYEPFTTYYYTPDEAPDFRPNIHRMYNWKYIT